MCEHRRNELEAFFVRKNIEAEPLLHDRMVGCLYVDTRALFQEQREVRHRKHVEVPSVVLNFGTFMSNAGVPMSAIACYTA